MLQYGEIVTFWEKNNWIWILLHYWKIILIIINCLAAQLDVTTSIAATFRSLYSLHLDSNLGIAGKLAADEKCIFIDVTGLTFINVVSVVWPRDVHKVNSLLMRTSNPRRQKSDKWPIGIIHIRISITSIQTTWQTRHTSSMSKRSFWGRHALLWYSLLNSLSTVQCRWLLALLQALLDLARRTSQVSDDRGCVVFSQN